MQIAAERLLNRGVRALAGAATTSAWKESLLDGARNFCVCVLLIRAGSSELVVEGARGLDEVPRLPILRHDAPAIDESLVSGDTIAAACVAGEISDAVARLLPGAPIVHIVPIAGREGVAAVLVTTGVRDAAPLELLCAAAGLALRSLPTQASEVIAIAPAQQPLVPKSKPMDLRARHFARVAVARMVLRHPSAIAAGRRSGDLYSALAPLIDAARDQYSARFLSDGARMDDYLHEELVGTLAGNDETHLGAEYPGPLH